MKNKKAQIGQTMTWSVATIIIIFILGIFVFAASSNNFLKLFGAGSEVPDSGSSFAEQQMVFAILDKDDGKIKTLIEQEKWDEAEQGIKVILDGWKSDGLVCSFSVSKGVIVKISYIGKWADFYPPYDLVKINDLYIDLECNRD